jgi:hypothetical protein
MDTQTIFKLGDKYFDIQKESLLRRGYTLLSENNLYAVYVKALPTTMASTGGAEVTGLNSK